MEKEYGFGLRDYSCFDSNLWGIGGVGGWWEEVTKLCAGRG